MKTQNCSTLLVLALCASLAPAAVAQVSGAAPATIFEHIGFGGGSQDMIVGMNVGPLALGNDVASSVKVSKCFKVTLYGAGPGQNGPELVLTADDDNLMDNDFNDILSNVLVERVPNCVASANVASEDVAAAVITPERQEAREAATTLLPSGTLDTMSSNLLLRKSALSAVSTSSGPFCPGPAPYKVTLQHGRTLTELATSLPSSSGPAFIPTFISWLLPPKSTLSLIHISEPTRPY